MNHAHAHRMMKNGIASMLLAMIGGFFLTFEMLGGISFSPVPVFMDMEIPGSARGWRILHIGMLMNGIMAIALAVALKALVLSGGRAAIVSWGVIVAVWGNALFYLFGMFAPNHGLSLHDSPLGEASLAGALAFVPAIIGAVTLFAALLLMLGARSSADPNP
ncbi:hypothetical protein [Algiphilus sp.]|uniref:hypothetical protein n=2 Tax=Algiphilus sp. TaxID=1872431 RepID=UPI0025C41E89|nr:hypothetical protein [Algiphilus sp.]MCI5061521.1 hypothetical protein [Algiphilus sp.]MCI5102283.1 hypothetical protein [Algiphilus sp.]MCR9090180.1 hypothetical protein [Pseudomonadota bacterium]